MKIVVGARGSKLSVVQSNLVINMLKNVYPYLDIKLKTIKTKGDILREFSLDKIGGKGVFVKEIENELLNGEIDIAIHSMKDMPGILPKGLKLSHVPKREDYRDVMILRKGLNNLNELPIGGKIGTGSKRRKYQLLRYRKDLNIVSIRGNIETRIRKIESEELDGVVLAAAGIKRLRLHEILENKIIYLDKEIMLPSPCQGILAIEIRENDEKIENLLKNISHEKTEVQAKVERAFLKRIGGNCKVPIGAYCEVYDEKVVLEGFLGTQDGSILINKTLKGKRDSLEKLGYNLADIMLKERDSK
ncbi:hydroxymethylbilane synthase [Keratinibaculum paraultunense]|uniref:Porphobilinogen deaminase n=1 Tax=Keratinibaculum paraultunense TaxID=1278232 RepID=A0A4R3KTF8_9FIRM|nr:hydroxymethylbilane synthase [Keratinibaculum paraultunense]QQY79550.1 hydroxymethylbilane synthase [Keratinibaculum paraultunense]TCS87575.1 hydroxymethylbilane synthase [Keratinibaculum paraultunense]